ncbi:glutamyl-tRNA(Gln) amidotransferase subunit C, mitochondrial-like isoform X2 [Hyalella azteca]|nr:glutamyl-tRNA(Gln) amidotransferase subunit C, mitochondrial-like isoform X2 [Hyalella azteca]
MALSRQILNKLHPISVIARLCSSDSGRGSAAIPQHPCKLSLPRLPSTEPVDLKLVQLLEKLSLVDAADAEGVRSLNYKISMADHLHAVDTSDVEPLITLLEDRSLRLSADEPEVDGGARKDAVLACALDTLEDFYVVPPGNIDYLPDERYYKNLVDGGATSLGSAAEPEESSRT